MKHFWTALAAFGLLTQVGCGGGGTTGGMDKDNFRLTVPILSTKLKQGEAKSVSIGISRGKGFEQDVGLKFDSVPQGVTVDPVTPTLKHGDTEAKVTVKAAEDAAVGDFTVKVTGHPAKGTDAVSELKITVEKK